MTPDQVPAPPGFVTFRLPLSANQANPYRYLIGCAHRRGFGSAVLDLDVPMSTGAAVQVVAKHIERENRCRNVRVIAATLLAGPDPNLVIVQVPESDNRDFPYRYLIGYAHPTGHGTHVLGSDVPLCTAGRVDNARHTIARQAGYHPDDVGILTLSLMTAPRRGESPPA